MRKRRLLLVDDQIILIDALRSCFASDPYFDVVGEARSADDALRLAREKRPDTIMLDVDLGQGVSGFDVAANLRGELPKTRIVIASMFEHRMYRDRAFEVGADAYVTKGVHFAALHAVLRGDFGAVPASEAKRCWQRPRDGWKPPLLMLTERELAVIQSIQAGRREKEVAQQFDISVSSVGTYLRRAMDKMGVSTRAELIQKAFAMGLVKCGFFAGQPEPPAVR